MIAVLLLTTMIETLLRTIDAPTGKETRLEVGETVGALHGSMRAGGGLPHQSPQTEAVITFTTLFDVIKINCALCDRFI